MKIIRLVSSIVLLTISFSLFASLSFATTYKYDELNRLIEVSYDSGKIIRYSYDAAGNMIEFAVSKPFNLNSIGNKTINVGQLLTFRVSVSGSEDDILLFAAYNLPDGAKFDADTGVFTWTPDYAQIGVYENIRFEAIVGDVVLSEEISITVNGANTTVGANIEVMDGGSGITVLFDNVETLGNTTVTVHNDLPEEIVSKVNMLPVYYDIETDAEFTDKVKIKVNYDTVSYEGNENDLRLYQLKDGKTIDITEPVNPGPGGNPDTEANTIEGVVEHFCFFGIGIPNRAPIANAGLDQIIEVKFDAGVEITMDGSLSYDPDASLKGMKEPDITPDGRDIVSYKWTGPFGEAEGVNPTVVLPVGEWECTLTVNDGWLESQDTFIISVKLDKDGSDENDDDDYGDQDPNENDDDENARKDDNVNGNDKNGEENKEDTDGNNNGDHSDYEYDNFPYVLFSGSKENSISIYGANIGIKGHVHTNNNFLFHGFNLDLDGICKASGGIVPIGNNIDFEGRIVGAQEIEMPDWIPEIKAKSLSGGKHIKKNQVYNGDTINLPISVVVDGDLSFNCSSVKATNNIFTSGNISINSELFSSTEEKEVVICSENGNIIINGSTFTLNGLIYAPNGTVVVNVEDFNFNGMLVANSVLIRGKNINIVDRANK